MDNFSVTSEYDPKLDFFGPAKKIELAEFLRSKGREVKFMYFPVVMLDNVVYTAKRHIIKESHMEIPFEIIQEYFKEFPDPIILYEFYPGSDTNKYTGEWIIRHGVK